MPVTGAILALDLATNTGVAFGPPGAMPVSYTIRLKRPGEDPGVAPFNLFRFLESQFATDRPALVVMEKMLPLQAFANLNNSAANVLLQFDLHAAVKIACRLFGIGYIDVPDSTVRKHFIGVSKVGTREETKRAVVQRAHLLGLMPRECLDDNRADAIAVHDWACATHGRRSATVQTLHLFNEQPRGRDDDDRVHG